MFEGLLALGIRNGTIVRVALPGGAVETVYTDEAGASPDGVLVEDGRIFWTTMGRPVRDPERTGEAGGSTDRHAAGEPGRGPDARRLRRLGRGGHDGAAR